MYFGDRFDTDRFDTDRFKTDGFDTDRGASTGRSNQCKFTAA